jgi:hypothetical protein
LALLSLPSLSSLGKEGTGERKRAQVGRLEAKNPSLVSKSIEWAAEDLIIRQDKQ